jgi:crotonobetainyl-CoA:carnitine CoA-transferase CaiB-like acyl-CoA transferase
LAELSAPPPSGAARALEGIRVLNLAEQYPGPYATMILADLGADVVLVERPNGGDPSRRFSGHWEALNRGKRSVAVDLKTAEGAEILWKFIAAADVLVEGFRPGVMSRLGFGAEQVLARHRELVYCSISAFGQTGPLSHAPGHDLAAQGTAGFVTGPGHPRPAPLPLADISSAMFAVIGVLTGLMARQRGIGGTRIDVAMLDCLVSWRGTSIVSSLNGLGPAPYPPDDPGYGVFQARDGSFVTISIAGEDHQWRALCDELGLAKLAGLSTPERERSKAALSKSVQAAILRTDPDELRSTLAARGVALGTVSDDLTVAANDQVRARGVIIETVGANAARVVRQPIIFDGDAGPAPARAPLLGEQTEELLRELGYTDEAIQKLAADQVIATGKDGHS